MRDFKLNARRVKAAMITQAKGGVRYYLNGILVGNKRIVSTDGHRMTIIESDDADFEPIILQIKGVIPQSARQCEFIFMGDDYGIVTMTTSSGVDIDKVIKFSVIDGKYPDYEKVIPSGKPVKVEEVGFNISYLADVSKVSKTLGGKINSGVFTFYNKDAITAVVDVNTPESTAKCIIMSVRL